MHLIRARLNLQVAAEYERKYADQMRALQAKLRQAEAKMKKVRIPFAT